MRTSARSILCATALIAATLTAAGPAEAAGPPHQAVTCGETITESIVVTNDLNCTGGMVALDIEASDVVLDLGGHTISGGGQGVGVALGLNQPVAFTGDEVEDGTFTDLGTAAELGYSTGPIFSHLHISNAASGDPVFFTRWGDVGNYQILDSTIDTPPGDYITQSSIEDTGGFTLENSTLNGGQIWLSQTTGPILDHDDFNNVSMTFDNEGYVRSTDSVFNDSPINDGPSFSGDSFSYDTFTGADTAVRIFDMSGETFNHDVFTSDGLGIDFDGTGTSTVSDNVFRDDGTGATDDSSGNTYSGNVFDHDSSGLGIYSASSQTISGNSFTNDGLGVYMEYPSGNTITGNRFINDANYGLYAWEQVPGCCEDISFTVSDNVAIHDGHQPGTQVDPTGDPVAGAFFIYAPDGGVTIQDNHSTDDGGYGVFALADAPDTVLTGNVSVHDAEGCNPSTACTYR